MLGPKFETWANVDNALRNGLRGLPNGSSLARLLAEKKGVRHIQDLPPLVKNLFLVQRRQLTSVSFASVGSKELGNRRTARQTTSAAS